MTAEDYTSGDARADESRARGTRAGPTTFGLIGLLVGVLIGFVVAWVLGGNPLSDVNEVRYLDLVVASVSDDADRICWSEDPERRDSPQTCAILALDPALDTPEEGQRLTIGVVEMSTPDGAEFLQAVYATPAGAAPEVLDDETEAPATP